MYIYVYIDIYLNLYLYIYIFGKAKLDTNADLNEFIQTWWTKKGSEETYSMNGNQIHIKM